MQKLLALATPIDKYIHLRNLASSNVSEFFQLLTQNTEQVLPFIYTPTVGEACQRYHELPLTPNGLYLSLRDRGSILEKLKGWKRQDIEVLVVTDGERILGLGDLGANGMGISEGKITLYTAAAGLDPQVCLPVCIDVGTNNKELRENKDYKGLAQPRATGREYDELLDEFAQALTAWRPHILLHFEDFGNANAFRLLDRYRHTHCCFNDDIQGTAAICLAAILSATRVTGKPFQEHKFLFFGAGEAGAGIGHLISHYLHRRCPDISVEEGRKRCFYIDSKGLVCKSRKDLQAHKVPFAHDVAPQPSLLAAVRALQPTTLIGVSTVPNTFTQEVIEAMSGINERPLIFPLSNPTSKSECTFEEAYKWSKGKVLFASGSPFDPITTPSGESIAPAQANNALIFPAVGGAAVMTRAREIPEEAFLIAAEALATQSPEEDIKKGHLFPPLSQLREAATKVMGAVADYFVGAGLGTRPEGCTDFTASAKSRMWAHPQDVSDDKVASKPDVGRKNSEGSKL